MPVVAFVQMLGPLELTFILVLVLMLFGAGRLPDVMRQFGRGVGRLRQATRIGEDKD